MRSEENTIVLNQRLKAVYKACCDILLPCSSAEMNSQSESPHPNPKPDLVDQYNQTQVGSSALKYNGTWGDIAYICTLGTALPFGICTAFYNEHFSVFLGLVMFGTLGVMSGVIAYFKHKDVSREQIATVAADATIQEERRDRKDRIHRVVENYIAIRRNNSLGEADYYGYRTLQKAGVLALKDDSEIRDACNLIEAHDETQPFDETTKGTDLKAFFEHVKKEHEEVGDWSGLLHFLLFQAQGRSGSKIELVIDTKGGMEGKVIDPPDEHKQGINQYHTGVTHCEGA